MLSSVPVPIRTIAKTMIIFSVSWYSCVSCNLQLNELQHDWLIYPCFCILLVHFTANRDHNVPDTNTQQYIRSTIMIGEEIASTSNQCSSSRRKPNLSNQKKSGSSSSSSPIMSPSYNQNNKQYRANIPRAVDLVESMFSWK